MNKPETEAEIYARLSRIGPTEVRRRMALLMAEERQTARVNNHKTPTGPRPIDLAELAAIHFFNEGVCEQ